MAQFSHEGYTYLVKSPDDLKQFPSSALVAQYNSATGKSIKKFSDRATAEQKVFGILMKQDADDNAEAVVVSAQQEIPDMDQNESVAVEAEAAPAPAPAPGSNRLVKFNLAGLEAVKACRPGTKRGIVVAMLRAEGGATFQEIMGATGWDKKTAYEGVRLINLYLGYELKTDFVTGKIVAIGEPTLPLVTRAPKAAAPAEAPASEVAE